MGDGSDIGVGHLRFSGTGTSPEWRLLLVSYERPAATNSLDVNTQVPIFTIAFSGVVRRPAALWSASTNPIPIQKHARAGKRSNEVLTSIVHVVKPAKLQ